MKFKKAPDAPKRFKSAFIFFSTDKHKTIRAQLQADGVAAKTADIAKLVSKAWKNLSPDERESWEAMARKDRARYEMEKTTYKGPWKVPAKKRSLKDPHAPKRPMSAYLAFSNSRRAMVKKENPQMGNAELSRLLSTMWKEAPVDVRKKYIDREFAKRQSYNVVMATWKANTKEEKRVKRDLREEVAIRAVEAAEQSAHESKRDRVVSHLNPRCKDDWAENKFPNAGGGFFWLPQAAPLSTVTGLPIPIFQSTPWGTMCLLFAS